MATVLAVEVVTNEPPPAPGRKTLATNSPIVIATKVLVINNIDNFRPDLLGISAVKNVWRIARKISGVAKVLRALRIRVEGNAKCSII